MKARGFPVVHCGSHVARSFLLLQRHISDKSSNGGDWQSADEPGEAGHVSISPTDIRAMVSEEMENVVRELVDEPTPALVELNDTRKVMDEMAFKAKVCLVHAVVQAIGMSTAALAR